MNEKISIGIIIDSLENYQVEAWALFLKDALKKELSTIFPKFDWNFFLIKRHDFPKGVPKDPLNLLEFGAEIKIENNYDFTIILTGHPLKARFEQGINAVPSAMLESAVITTSKITELSDENIQKESVISLVKHILGHLWGLDHNDKSVMKPRKSWKLEKALDWNDEEKKSIFYFLKDVADPRVEETSTTKNRLIFFIQVFLTNWKTIIKDIVFFRSWRMVLNLGRFTAATAVSIIFLFLSAEAWEMGAAIQSSWLDAILFGVILLATLSLYFGQNLQGIGKSDKMMEQAVRCRIILFGTLFIGMASFWINLLGISFVIIHLLPKQVIAGWTGLSGGSIPIFHFSKLMATFGVLASSVGGNLEEEQDIKAVLIYTEET